MVDDEREILDIICQVLDDDGFNVVCMDNPRSVIEAEDALEASLYLLDLMLPGMSGIQLAGKIRQKDEGKAPIIAMSASADMLRRARESGYFDDILSKPFDLSELLNRVELYAR